MSLAVESQEEAFRRGFTRGMSESAAYVANLERQIVLLRADLADYEIATQAVLDLGLPDEPDTIAAYDAGLMAGQADALIALEEARAAKSTPLLESRRVQCVLAFLAGVVFEAAWVWLWDR